MDMSPAAAMPNIGGTRQGSGGVPQRGPGAELQSPGRGSVGLCPPEAVSFSVYSGSKIPCFATQSNSLLACFTNLRVPDCDKQCGEETSSAAVLMLLLDDVAFIYFSYKNFFTQT